ncbi:MULTISPECIES: hypothetical protein [Burkholderia]|jgi:hypothetical protein|uniref:Lipoprotein n=2 Tax=Burkholderia contaminans TaxID=488447 RepID=A0A1E3FU19_9BURK|nr:MULTISPECIES: hypothetical protein [Burkholderia]UTP25331.1 hypothetical protein NMB33_19080 [Burkholderia sp. FXe9]KKL33229.1 hypothetical protein WR31_35300 [Burkholderia contaminans LMG 23361]MBA9827549.1 hypothetical protein [Burkholderia contaminans]MBA9836441.1 hypothetical protein [Burkholderia contaminans]MBA9860946.1 hypothetical protein [Burkholderia contaminans]
MTIRLIPWLIAIGTACTGLAAHAAGTAHSLDQVPGKFSSPDARAAYAREMSGAPEPDGFGAHLPPGFTKEALVAQLAPGQPLGRVVLVGAKPWPQRPGSFVAIVCAAPTDGLASEVLKFGVPTDCEGYEHHPGVDDTKELVWLGVFERGADGGPRLVARTEQPLDQAIDWSQTNIESPDPARTENDVAIRPERWLRFDLAPYALRTGDAAFGVRAGWSIGYAGGGASFEALYLFRIDGKTLRVVFAQPMMYFQDIGGDWHRDGTRDHDITEGSNTLNVLPTSTEGFHDLQLRQRGGKWRQTFRWSAADGEYQPR